MSNIDRILTYQHCEVSPANWDEVCRHITAMKAELDTLKSEVVIKHIDHAALNNSNRKLTEANARIVEFEDIKKGHLKMKDKLQSRLERAESLLREWSNDLEEGGAYLVEEGFEEPKHCQQFRKIQKYFAEVEK